MQVHPVKEKEQPLLCYLSLLIFLMEDSCVDLEPCICGGIHYAKEFCIVCIIGGSKTCGERIEEGGRGREEGGERRQGIKEAG